MNLCINPFCQEPDHQGNRNNRICQSCGSELLLRFSPKNPDPRKPNQVIEYEVKELVSEKTGFGIIYKVYEQNTPKILKVLKDNLNTHDKAVELFQQEAKVLSELNHPSIPRVDGYFQHKICTGQILHCLGMEYIDGINLEEYLEQHNNNPISESQAISWLNQIARILDLLHNKELFHRDIKPQNIMLRKNGQLVLIDFGTARYMTTTYLAKIGAGQEITAVVSRGYTSPEQANGKAVPQSDFFALGRSFVHLLTAKHPLEFYDAHNDVFNWRTNIKISAKLADLIDDLMAKQPADRPLNTKNLLERINKLEIQKQLETEKYNRKISLLIFGSLSVIFGGLIFNYLCFLFNICPPPKCPPICDPPPPPECPGPSCPTPTSTPTSQEKPKIEKGIVIYPYKPGQDRKGRTAEFNIAILSAKYRWQIGNSEKVQDSTSSDQLKTLGLSQLNTNLKEDKIFNIMENPNGIIAVGTASCEGSQLQEEKRALARAKKIRDIVVKDLFDVKELHFLNLGQFKKDTCQKRPEITSFQRSIIIVGIKKQTPGVILEEALRDRLSKNIQNFDLDDYTLFKFNDDSLSSPN